MRSWGRALLALVVALAIVSAATAASGTGPKGRFKAAGHKLYLTCKGSGKPTVVLDAGLGDNHESWPYIARTARRLHTRVCAYDRFGLGRSDGARSKLKTRTIGAAAADLRALLPKARLKAPYVFVAHSIAGLVDREFARRYPSKVAGMVLLDTAPDDWDIYTGYTGKRPFVWGHERLNVTAASAALRASDTLGAKPLVVIEAGNTLDVQAWANGKERLSGLLGFRAARAGSNLEQLDLRRRQAQQSRHTGERARDSRRVGAPGCERGTQARGAAELLREQAAEQGRRLRRGVAQRPRNRAAPSQPVAARAHHNRTRRARLAGGLGCAWNFSGQVCAVFKSSDSGSEDARTSSSCACSPVR